MPNRDLQTLDFLDNDLIARMAEATSFHEWWALRQQRIALQEERQAVLDMQKTRLEKAKLNNFEIDRAREMIEEMQNMGRPSSAIIERLQDTFVKLRDEADAQRVYWTETKRIATQDVAYTAHELGFDKYQVILSPSACEKCRSITQEGTRIFKQAEFEKAGYGHVPPFHPNCVTGDTVVVAPSVTKIIRAKYDGVLVKIILSNGRTLSVTENHMVLARRGFIAAKTVSQGDDIVCSLGTERIFQQNPDNNDRVASIEEIFDASVHSFGMTASSVPATPEYLHGDGRFCNGDIDVISPDCLLGNTVETAHGEHGHKDTLGGVGLNTGFDCIGNLDSVLVALALAADGIVGGSGVSGVLGLGTAAVNQLKGLLDASNYDARLEKVATDDRTGNPELLSETVFALSGFVQFAKVVGVQRIDFHGYVYDLQTTSSLYTANGIVGSNCYCITVPHVA